MDELKAYEIFGLQVGCSLEELKTAYTSLLKQYHPEEHPEEFAQIQEAYTVISRALRQQRRNSAPVQEQTPEKRPQQETAQTLRVEISHPETEKPEGDKPHFQFEHYKTHWAEQESKPQEAVEKPYDFERVLEEEETQETLQRQKLIEKALRRMEEITSPSLRNHTSLFEVYFNEQDVRDVLNEPEFMAGLTSILKSVKLKGPIYDSMIKAYNFKSCEPNHMITERFELYKELDSRRGIHRKKKQWGAVSFGLFAALAFGVKLLTRTARAIDSEMVTFLLMGLAVVAVLITIGCVLYREHTLLASIAVPTACFAGLQFLASVWGTYQSVLGSLEVADTLAILLFFLANFVLLILAVCGIVQAVRHRKQKRVREFVNPLKIPERKRTFLALSSCIIVFIVITLFVMMNPETPPKSEKVLQPITAEAATEEDAGLLFAKVEEIHEEYYLIAPLEGEETYGENVKFELARTKENHFNTQTLTVGSPLEIYYTYPTQGENYVRLAKAVVCPKDAPAVLQPLTAEEAGPFDAGGLFAEVLEVKEDCYIIAPCRPYDEQRYGADTKFEISRSDDTKFIDVGDLKVGSQIAVNFLYPTEGEEYIRLAEASVNVRKS